MAAPRVSVIMPVYNTRPYLERCFGSVYGQSIGQDAIQVVAVDDGSSDGSDERLAELAHGHPNVTVLHQKNSGGPGGPRNAGIEHAEGEYLFFLDSDDYLGPEALERLIAMADAHASDVVYGRIVGVGGRKAPVEFRVTTPKADLFESSVYWTLAPYKLFRRSLVDEHALRFAEGRMIAEDQPFSAHALLHAGTISIVADHDCYFLEGRGGDGTNASEQFVDWTEQFPYIERNLFRLIADHVPAGPNRDKLLHRHFHGEVLGPFGPRFLELDEDDRAAMAGACRGLIDRWMNDAIMDALPPGHRLRACCIRDGRLAELEEIIRVEPALGPPIIESGRAYAAYPFRRPATAADGMPAELYDLTDRLAVEHSLTRVDWQGATLRLGGTARIGGVGTEGQRIDILVRSGEITHRMPARPGSGSFAVDVDLATVADGEPLPAGLWGFRAEVTAEGITKEAVLGFHRADHVDTRSRPRAVDLGMTDLTVVTCYYAGPYMNLTLDVGETRRPLGHAVPGEVTWTRPGRHAEISATLDLPGCPADALFGLIVRDAGDRDLPLWTAPERDGDATSLTATLHRPPVGTWTARLAIVADRLTMETHVAGPDGEPLRFTVRRRRPLRRIRRRMRMALTRGARR